MRILLCAAFYPPYRGGYAESVRDLAQDLARRGSRVTVASCDVRGLPDEYADGAVRVVRIPSRNPSFLHGSFPLPSVFSALIRFRRLMRDGQDIVYTNTRFFPITWLGFFFAKAYRVPACHIERGASHPASHSRIIALAGTVIDQTLGRIVCAFADRVIGVSDAARDFAGRLGARNPLCIHTGIDTAWWHRPSWIAPDPFHISYVGRLVHGKGVQDLLCAAAALRPDFPRLSLSIAGDGPHRAHLLRLAGELGIGDAVSFLGDLDPPRVRDLLWRSAILANPSHSEGLPRSVLEAAAAGVPAVATDVGGTREIIAPGCGILVPSGDIRRLADGIRNLLTDSVLSSRMARAAHERIAGAFSRDATVGAYEHATFPCAASPA